MIWRDGPVLDVYMMDGWMAMSCLFYKIWKSGNVINTIKTDGTATTVIEKWMMSCWHHKALRAIDVMALL